MKMGEAAAEKDCRRNRLVSILLTEVNICDYILLHSNTFTQLLELTVRLYDISWYLYFFWHGFY